MVEDSSEYIRRFYNFRIIGKEAKSKKEKSKKKVSTIYFQRDMFYIFMHADMSRNT